MKRVFTTAFIIATIALGAQTTKLKKACVKMEKEENGKITKIDTCVTAATDEELQQKISALGLGDMPELPPLPQLPPIPEVPPIPGVPPVPPVPPTEVGKEVSTTRVIIIDDGEEGNKEKRNSGTKKHVKVVSSGAGEEAEVIIMDGEGKVLRSSSGKDDHVVIKKMKAGEKADPEIEKIMEGHGIDMKDGEAHKIVIKNTENKNGKERSEVKVYVFNKVEIKDLSAEDKKQLPADAAKVIEKSRSFNNLNVAPNPTEDACTLSYKPSSKEVLQINVYDTNGKTVYAETDKNVGEQINKTLSLREFGKGIYFVHLTQGRQSEVRKVIVK